MSTPPYVINACTIAVKLENVDKVNELSLV